MCAGCHVEQAEADVVAVGVAHGADEFAEGVGLAEGFVCVVAVALPVKLVDVGADKACDGFAEVGDVVA